MMDRRAGGVRGRSSSMPPTVGPPFGQAPTPIPVSRDATLRSASPGTGDAADGVSLLANSSTALNLAISILRLTGHASIASALRHHARRTSRPLQTIMRC